MTDDSDDTKPKIDSLTPAIDEDRPLDALLPEIDQLERVGDVGPVEKTAVHPRVLEVELEDAHQWAMACWDDPGMHELHRQLERLMASTILAEMSRPSGQPDLPEREFEAFELVAFAKFFPESASVLSKLGFEQADYVPDQYVERMDAWRLEAEELGHDLSHRPDSVWRSEFRFHGSEMDSRLDGIHRGLRAKLDGELWGETPGGPSKLAADFLRRRFNTRIEPSLAGLDEFAMIVVQEPGDYIRWMRPLLFQAVCDFVGVVLQAEGDYAVDWAVCEPDDDGFVPPPLFRLRSAGEATHVPIGRWLVEWCMMPTDPESPDSLSERLAAELAAL